MRKIIYYVACSLDGFIAGRHHDISGFVGAGNGVSQYLKDLSHFDTVIMGRNTYEFGYAYGLQPGQAAYPGMQHFIFSNTLTFADPDPHVHLRQIDLNEIEKIQHQAGTDIYLCGGGQFAGWLLEHKKIDVLKIKLNPLLLGGGVKLFGESSGTYKLDLIDVAEYEYSLQILTYRILYTG